MLLTRQPWPGPSITVGCYLFSPSCRCIYEEHTVAVRVREILVSLAEGAILVGMTAKQMPGMITSVTLMARIVTNPAYS